LGGEYELTADPERDPNILPKDYELIDNAQPRSEEYDPLASEHTNNAQ
jgi:hypothetical protein